MPYTYDEMRDLLCNAIQEMEISRGEAGRRAGLSVQEVSNALNGTGHARPGALVKLAEALLGGSWRVEAEPMFERE